MASQKKPHWSSLCAFRLQEPPAEALQVSLIDQCPEQTQSRLDNRPCCTARLSGVECSIGIDLHIKRHQAWLISWWDALMFWIQCNLCTGVWFVEALFEDDYVSSTSFWIETLFCFMLQDVLYTVCNPIGNVLRIVIFKRNGIQAMVEYPYWKEAHRRI